MIMMPDTAWGCGTFREGREDGRMLGCICISPPTEVKRDLRYSPSLRQPFYSIARDHEDGFL